MSSLILIIAAVRDTEGPAPRSAGASSTRSVGQVMAAVIDRLSFFFAAGVGCPLLWAPLIPDIVFFLTAIKTEGAHLSGEDSAGGCGDGGRVGHASDFLDASPRFASC